MKFLLSLVISFLSLSVWAGFPCPPNSCDPNNSCLDGCKKINVIGSSSCVQQTYEDAVLEAKQNAYGKAHGRCGADVEIFSRWNVTRHSAYLYCEVEASTTYLCIK